jgi:hypothetical protein
LRIVASISPAVKLFAQKNAGSPPHPNTKKPAQAGFVCIAAGFNLPAFSKQSHSPSPPQYQKARVFPA